MIFKKKSQAPQKNRRNKRIYGFFSIVHIPNRMCVCVRVCGWVSKCSMSDWLINENGAKWKLMCIQCAFVFMCVTETLLSNKSMPKCVCAFFSTCAFSFTFASILYLKNVDWLIDDGDDDVRAFVCARLWV